MRLRGVGSGFVNIYDPNGKLIQRFAARGLLNAPWGVALAPSSFRALRWRAADRQLW